MAEWAIFSVASKLLITIASPAFKKAYEKGQSIRKASEDLDKLKASILTIQAGLLDAEKKQESSTAVKDWMKRIREVLYDAEDLFDKVATDDMLKRNKKVSSLKEKAQASFSKVESIFSRKFIANKVKAIRKSLLEISRDMEGFKFVLCPKEDEAPNGLRRGRQDPGSFVDAKDVIGRDVDKKSIFEMIFNESNNGNSDVLVVISIVGIGGMGKTTLAQLIYNDDMVKMNFEKRWFACISDTSDEKEFLGKVFQSMYEGSYSDFTVSQLQTKIRDSIKGQKILLVLDDVWDDHHGRWQDRMSLLSSAAKGSKIIITTRSSTVSRATDALRTHNLDGLSEDESWLLFKRVAFTPEQENDPRWIDLGREIVKKCRNVPLAIKSIGSLLFEKFTLQEWESFKDEELSMLKGQGGEYIVNTLKLSYEYLSSNLKHCFAYCSLFPKDARFEVKKLICLWIAQGYIKLDHELQRIEQKGESCFMYLFRRGFFQEAMEDDFGGILTCKMHDLVHDLAQHVAGEECVTLSKTSSNISKYTRHVSIRDIQTDESWIIAEPLCNVNKLRSFLFMDKMSSCIPPLDQIFANFKLLRALSLSCWRIKNVSSSIGELKHLRYLDLSKSKFVTLPNSMTNLLNLITLDVRDCTELKVLPYNLQKLSNLMYLSIKDCSKLKHMPPRTGEMTSLQHLSDFKVGKAGSKGCGLDALAGLVQLRGELTIEFEDGIEDWDGDKDWELPISLQSLYIFDYPGRRIPDWGSNGRTNNLERLELCWGNEVTYLPPLRCLPYLKQLILRSLIELEFVEDGDNCTIVAGSLFFPRLELLELSRFPKLMGWSRKVASAATSSTSALLSFPLLSSLTIDACPELKSFPLCPLLQELELRYIDGNEEIEKWLSNNYNSSTASITQSLSPSSFQEILFSPHLQHISISGFHTLEVMHLAPPKLQQLLIRSCRGLRKLHIAHPNAIEELEIINCPQWELLWESQDNGSCHLDWDSLTNLRELRLHPLPPSEKLPQCLRHRQALGQLQITKPW